MEEANKRRANYGPEKGSYMFDVQHADSWFWYVNVIVDLFIVSIIAALMQLKKLGAMEDWSITPAVNQMQKVGSSS